MNTPLELGIKKGTRVPPKKGWKENTWYVVEVAYSSNNIIHKNLLYTGFLNEKGEPGGYHGLIPTEYVCNDENKTYREPYYLKYVKELEV